MHLNRYDCDVQKHINTKHNVGIDFEQQDTKDGPDLSLENLN